MPGPGFRKGNMAAKRKKLKKKTIAEYERVAAAADKKVAAAELAFNADPC